jgi:hypothetical protein
MFLRNLHFFLLSVQKLSASLPAGIKNSHAMFVLNKSDLKLLNIAVAITSCLLFSGCHKDDVVVQQVNDNAGFDSGTSNPSSWYHSPNGSVDLFLWEIKPASSADHYVSIFPGSASPDFFYWAQEITNPIPLGEKLTLRAKIKGENLSGEGVSIAFRCDDATFNSVAFVTTQHKTNISGNFDWKEFSITLDEVPESTAKIYVFLIYLPNTTGKASFDDVTLAYTKK